MVGDLIGNACCAAILKRCAILDKAVRRRIRLPRNCRRPGKDASRINGSHGQRSRGQAEYQVSHHLRFSTRRGVYELSGRRTEWPCRLTNVLTDTVNSIPIIKRVQIAIRPERQFGRSIQSLIYWKEGTIRSNEVAQKTPVSAETLHQSNICGS